MSSASVANPLNSIEPLAVISEDPKPQENPPINFFYTHFHDSIRFELDALSRAVLELEPAADEDFGALLEALRDRYLFLEQLYKYHSSVEDEVGIAVHLCWNISVFPRKNKRSGCHNPCRLCIRLLTRRSRMSHWLTLWSMKTR